MKQPGFRELCRGEPFRIFFPLGLLAGISGVSLWPLFFSGIHQFYPALMHARLMIEGFLTAFVIGFLGTAGPRLTSTPPFARWELRVLIGGYLMTVVSHIAEQPRLGDAVFLALILFFIGRMGWRFSVRGDLPPPGFALVGLGLLNAVVGTALLLAGGTWDWPRTGAFGTMLLHQSFVLHLILGVGSFLLPRFLKLPPKPEFPESRTPPPGWSQQALFAAACGLVITLTYALESYFALTRWPGVIRFVASAAYLLVEMPLHRTGAPRLTIVQCLRVSMVLVVLGLLFPALWPAQRLAGMHVVFIGGFSLITLTVATRVVLGHSGLGHLFQTRLPFLAATALLLLTGMALRFAADFLPMSRPSLMNWAAYAWMLGAIIWGVRVLPKVRIADSENAKH
jgi:uncharacterized protein involved in response to NO